jgi:NADPH:quinone reductase-like Zn-dependent oxidoreductase
MSIGAPYPRGTVRSAFCRLSSEGVWRRPCRDAHAQGRVARGDADQRHRGEAFPLSGIPFQEIIAKVETGTYKAAPSRVFAFEEIAEAHRMMDASEAAGKVVVVGAL